MTATATPPAVTARGRRFDDTSPDGTPPQRRRRRALLVGALVLVVVAAVVLQVLSPDRSTDPYSPDSAEPDGARATAQVLGQQGVEITYVRTTAAAIAEAEAGSTLLVIAPSSLREVQLEALADVEADLVLAGSGGDDLRPLTDRVETAAAVPRESIPAGCDDPDATAAGSITSGARGLVGDATLCFAGADGTGAQYATWTEDDRTWRVIADPWLMTNEGLAVDGNAALVLRALGATERLVWYLPDPNDTFGQESEATGSLPLPGPAVLLLFLVGVVLVLWRGRRLGPVVVEPLPVVVKATETTRGRGRLYRRAGAHGHAAAALRAGLVARVARRVGLPAHADADQVIETLARASGRSPEAIRDVLYGPAPTSDTELTTLTHALDTLESEVLRA